MSVHGKEYCECSNRVEVGKGDAAVCRTCYDLQQWWKQEQLRLTVLREEAQWEWGDFLRKKPEPDPVAPPNTLFHIIGYRHYFLVDRYAKA